jgi:hypothetical protein
MTAIVNAISGALLSITGFDVLKHVMLVCGAGVLVTMLLLTYGLDLSPGFF